MTYNTMHELFVAVSHGRADDVERLYGPLFLSRGESGFKLFSRLFKHAMRQSPINTQILQHLSQSVEESNASELQAVLNSALYSAARRGSLEAVEWLASNGATALGTTVWWDGPYRRHRLGAVCEAACNGHLEIVKFLVANGGATNLDTAVYMAAFKGHLEVVQWLVANGATGLGQDPLLLAPPMRYAVSTAACNGHLEIVKFLVANGATNLNDAVYAAASTGKLEVLQWLVANGATGLDQALDVLKQPTRGWTTNMYAVYVAAAGGHLDVAL